MIVQPQPPSIMSIIASDSRGNLYLSNLNPIEKPIFITHKKLLLDIGYSRIEAENEAWRKIQSLRKLEK